jgi:hypothetical protein
MIEALVISVNEPQLDRCLVSVRNQVVPFSNIVHVNGVVPEYLAFNQGMGQTRDEWAMKIDGDFILYENAVDIATNYMNQYNNRKCCNYAFGLIDTFLECPIGYCCIFKTLLYKQYPYTDKLSNDRKANYFLRSLGWRVRKNVEVVLGTHFDKPSEFQVFKRFYTQWIKYPNNSFIKIRMRELLERTGNTLYDIGLKAGQFADKKKSYPGSHNLTFDLQLFEEFKNENNT